MVVTTIAARSLPSKETEIRDGLEQVACAAIGCRLATAVDAAVREQLLVFRAALAEFDPH
jgi:hypothetical protein